MPPFAQRTTRISEQKSYLRLDYFFDVVEPVPDDWRFMVGDVLHNLRSTLDNIIWSLAVKHSGPNPPNERAIGFPVVLTAVDFESRSAMLTALDPRVRAVVKALQPIEESDPSDDALYLLHQLDRLDKHRTVSVVRHQLHAFDIQITPPPDDLNITRHPDVALEHGTPIATVTFRRSTETRQVDVNPVFAYYEAIEETSDTPLLPLVPFLEGAVGHVATCLDELAPYLD